MIKQIIITLLVMITTACTSVSQEYRTIVLDESGIRPDWANDNHGSKFKLNGRMNFIGSYTTKHTNQSPTWLCMTASSLAKKQISDANVQRYKTKSEVKHYDEQDSLAFLGREESAMEVNDLQYEGCYWARLSQIANDGVHREIVYRVYARYSLDLDIYKKLTSK